MELESVRCEVADRIATITLDRPERRNAFTGVMGRELAAAYERCDTDDEVRVVVLTGAPPAFCAGADLAGGDATFGAPGEGFSAAGVAMPAWRVRKPVVAAVNGHAVGIGLTLALQADIRLMARDAVYGVVQARRGVVGDAYSHWVLPRLVGMSRAAEILLTGATFDGARAHELGLCSRVLEADQVLPAALELARDIAVNTAPASVAASKRMLWSSFEHDADQVGAQETAAHHRLMGSDDAREGVRSHLEKRAPRWTGRAE